MSRFIELAKALAEKQLSDVDTQMQQIKTEKDILNETFDQQLSQLKMVKASHKAGKQQIDAQQKMDKINKDLVKMMIDSGEVGPMAVGGQMVDEFAGVQTEPEAQGLPIIQGMQL